MRRILTTAATGIMVLAMMAAPAYAQTRSTSGNSTTRSTGTTTTSRSTGTTSTTTRSASTQDNKTRSTGTTTTSRSTGTTSTSRSTGTTSTSRSTGTVTSGSSTRSTGTTTTSRSTGTTSTTTRSATSQDNNTRSTGTTSTSRSTGTTGTTSRSTGTTSTTRSTTGTTSTTRSSGTVSGTTTRSTGTTGTTTRSTGATSTTRSTTGTSSTTRSTGTTTRSSSTAASGSTVRSATNVTRGGLTGASSGNSGTTAGKAEPKETYKDNGGNYRYNDDMRLDDRHDIHRVPPRERNVMPWDRPGNFWGDHPHYYGYRINALPPQYRRISHWGIDYYFHSGIYYRPYGGVYVVCRPPFGTPLEAAIDRAILRAIRFSYYCNTYRTYNTVFDNYNVIAQQNLIIAQNNARIAAQNANYALNSSRALTAYELANKLGLVQSYAYANSEYFYQDGVFYTVSASGSYSTIVPPAGALVTSLPDDYEIIVLNGIEYYMVDNTVYRTTLFDGEPFLEVLGQMYGSLYNQYNIYR